MFAGPAPQSSSNQRPSCAGCTSSTAVRGTIPPAWKTSANRLNMGFSLSPVIAGRLAARDPTYVTVLVEELDACDMVVTAGALGQVEAARATLHAHHHHGRLQEDPGLDRSRRHL